jgi:hypothetical protein
MFRDAMLKLLAETLPYAKLIEDRDTFYLQIADKSSRKSLTTSAQGATLQSMRLG